MSPARPTRAPRRGLPCFGPTAELARLESSKGYARQLASCLGIPGPASPASTRPTPAIAWCRSLGRPVVVKLDGLAAGKGVTVPADDDETIAAIRAAAGPFVLEERLSGPECSLLALCDGRMAPALPLAQDHKRIGEGDTGPNTGGMGAYAPAPVPYDGDELVATFVQPVLDHLAAAGTPYVGVLYAGLMLTADGPRLIEFNCRFGDPEAQAVLPLVESDVAELPSPCTRGDLAAHHAAGARRRRLHRRRCRRRIPGSSDRGRRDPDGFARSAGRTVRPTDPVPGRDGRRAVTGGRVLAVTGLGGDLAAARAAAYEAMASIRFDGMQVRRDIGWRAPGATLARTRPRASTSTRATAPSAR